MADKDNKYSQELIEELFGVLGNGKVVWNEYIFVTAPFFIWLPIRVNQLISIGYQPLGSPTILEKGVFDERFVQAMVRSRPTEKES